jgi:hypothetical protein
MHPLPLPFHPEDAPRQTRYRWLVKPFLIMLLLIPIGVLVAPYSSLTLYPYFVFATLPLPPGSSQIGSALNLRMACHGMDIQRTYVTGSNAEDVRHFFTTHASESDVWIITNDSVLSNGEWWWQGRRVITGWDAPKRLMFLNLFLLNSSDNVQPALAEQTRQALREGKTAFILRLNYVDDIQRNRASVGDSTSECFLD